MHALLDVVLGSVYTSVHTIVPNFEFQCYLQSDQIGNMLNIVILRSCYILIVILVVMN